MTEKPMIFNAFIYDIRTKADGGGRIQLDFGADSLLVLQELQRLTSLGGKTNFAFVVVDPSKIEPGLPTNDENSF